MFAAPEQAAAAAHPTIPDVARREEDTFEMSHNAWDELDEGDRDLVRTASRRGALSPTRSHQTHQTIVTEPCEAPGDKIDSPGNADTPNEKDIGTPFDADSPGANADAEARAGADLVPFASQQDKDQILVHWEGNDDPENPHNWSFAYRVFLTSLAGMLVFNSTFVSTVPNGTMEQILEHFHVSREVGTLTISIYVAGYCLGPLIWAPLSERVGRYPPTIIALTGFICFNVGCALSKNIGSLLVFRFLVGVFGACPLTTSGAIIFDLWPPKARGFAMVSYSLAPSAGPALGPIVSGAIQVTGTLWRWSFYVSLIFSGVMLIIAFTTLRETYAPAILARKAKRLRKQHNDERYVAPIELIKFRPKDFAYQLLLKPVVMMAYEPMLLSVSIFLAYGYGLLYLLFEFYSTYHTIYGLNALQEGLTFLPFFVGNTLCCIFYAAVTLPAYNRKLDAAIAQGETKLPPEARLPISRICGPFLAISFFWFGWASYKEATLWAPLLSGLLIGGAVCALFIALTTYVVEAYQANAASGLAAQTILRSATGAALPLAAQGMLSNMGVHWASSLLAFLAILMTPIPFVLERWGSQLRAKSRFAF